MKIIVTGATGFIGSALIKKLLQLGHVPFIVSRNQKSAAEHFPELKAEQFIEADLNQTALDSKYFHGVDAVIHLAGESIDGRWTAEKKKRILDSRVHATENILKNIPSKNMIFISASAQGIYGDRGDEWVSESAQHGTDFLAEVCEQWEKPSVQMQTQFPENRVVILRFGMVLSATGGALAKMLKIYRAHLGAIVGSGDQWISWIALEDLCGIIIKSLSESKIRGPLNVSTEFPVRHSQWTQLLCQRLGVNQMPRVPGLALKMLLGEMASIALVSIRMRPQVLLDLNYQFKYRDLESFFKSEV